MMSTSQAKRMCIYSTAKATGTTGSTAALAILADSRHLWGSIHALLMIHMLDTEIQEDTATVEPTSMKGTLGLTTQPLRHQAMQQ